MTPDAGQSQRLVLIEPIQQHQLSARTWNMLVGKAVHTWGELAVWSDAELLRCPNFGRKSLNELKAELAKRKLTLHMDRQLVADTIAGKNLSIVLPGPATVPRFDEAIGLLRQARRNGYGDETTLVGLYRLWHEPMELNR